MNKTPIVTIALLLLWVSVSYGAEPTRYTQYSTDTLEKELRKLDTGLDKFNNEFNELHEKSLQRPLDYEDRVTKARLASKIKTYEREREKLVRILDKRIHQEEKISHWKTSKTSSKM